jgi:hypothetical protein
MISFRKIFRKYQVYIAYGLIAIAYLILIPLGLMGNLFAMATICVVILVLAGAAIECERLKLIPRFRGI